MITIVLSLISIFLIHKLLNYNRDFFDKRNVKHYKGIPGLGHILDPLFKKDSLYFDTFTKFYNEFSDSRFFGIFQLQSPLYVIRDVELIKDITIKYADHFENHRIELNKRELVSSNLFFLSGQKWKCMRAMVTPAYTSSKLRQLFVVVSECVNETIQAAKDSAQDSLVKVDLKQFFLGFTVDSIVYFGFGLRVNSVKDPENEFYKLARDALTFNRKTDLKFLLFATFPKFMQFLRIKLFSEETEQRFRNLVSASLEIRKKNLVNNDFISLIEKSGETMTDDEFVGSMLGLFWGGFDTIRTLCIFVTSYLGKYPEVEEKLIQEVDELNERLDDKPVSYEDLKELKYMEMVISEVLRVASPTPILDRKCSKPFVMEDFNGNKVQLNVGDNILIPIDAIHYDEKYYPDPHEFRPERFSNKSDINQFAYLPFGLGPRNCIGGRLGIMTCKAMLHKMFSTFRIESCNFDKPCRASAVFPVVLRVRDKSYD